MMTLAIFLEEQSTREMLKGMLPKILPQGVSVRYVVFEGKQDLKKRLARRLKGWRTPDTAFVVLLDQDAAECRDVKDTLVGLCRQAGKPGALVRIACRELESWYFGDLQAVEQGLDIAGVSMSGDRAKFRIPDAIRNPARELQRVTNGTYQKVSGSRAIGPHMDPYGNKSPSFKVFVQGVERIVASMET